MPSSALRSTHTLAHTRALGSGAAVAVGAWQCTALPRRSGHWHGRFVAYKLKVLYEKDGRQAELIVSRRCARLRAGTTGRTGGRAGGQAARQARRAGAPDPAQVLPL